ncbi:glycosyltransferase [Bacillus carboniphilus]|uniref:Glycosyltransferase n=1 Tax=Bacillus carboniphilus TaxID=86663 RepID=A0ABY9JQ93_9BACI|nr:glycosyltransferase [Bacillus carboniphilus]WLR41572.1 glycosyltransferase [Bacillus carboniphilus]
MRLVFAHDHIFHKFNNQYYSTGGLSKEMLERYTAVFDEVIVISRQKHIKTYNDKLTLASTKNVKFVEIPNFKSIDNSPKIFKAKKIIYDEVLSSDSLIARLPSSIGELAVYADKKNNKPYLVEVVACPWDAFWNHSFKGKVIAPFKYFKTKKLVREASYSIYVTNQFLQGRYPTNGKVENCSNVALKEFDDYILDIRLKKIQELNQENRLVIGTTAAINVRYKGQQYIIEALGKLKKQGNTKFEYQLVGGGDSSFLRSVAEKNDVTDQVKFIGSLSHNKVFEWLDTIDIYAQPSRQEGLPRGLIEAMSRALPAFGANTAGIPELLENEYIFSNTRKNINEICLILDKFDKKSMFETSKRNYLESKNYDKKIIEKRRNKFLKEFGAIEKK